MRTVLHGVRQARLLFILTATRWYWSGEQEDEADAVK